MFEVTEQIALKMAIKVKTSCNRALSTFTNLNFRLVQQKISKNAEKCKKLQRSGLKNS